MMAGGHAATVVGEIHCVSCWSVLAEAVRQDGTPQVQLGPIDAFGGIPVTVDDHDSFRCGRCRGWAFLRLVAPRPPARLVPEQVMQQAS